MPTISIYPPSPSHTTASHPSVPGLPQILNTPSGLALLEIQGTINTSGPTDSEESSQPIGKLVFPGYDASRGPDDASWTKRVYLYVGKHQRLTGEAKKLTKPVAVLRKKNAGDGEGEEALEVAEVVRWKLIFAHRPEPVGGEASAGG